LIILAAQARKREMPNRADILTEGRRKQFKEYCQYIDSTMRDEAEKYIDQTSLSLSKLIVIYFSRAIEAGCEV